MTGSGLPPGTAYQWDDLKQNELLRSFQVVHETFGVVLSRGRRGRMAGFSGGRCGVVMGHYDE